MKADGSQVESRNRLPPPPMSALLETHCPTLTLVARGKVRDLYEVPGHPDALLFVATDRVSAFDVSMLNVRPRSTLALLTGAGDPQQGKTAHRALAVVLRLLGPRARDEAHPEPCDHVPHRGDARRRAGVPRPARGPGHLGAPRDCAPRRGYRARVHHWCVIRAQTSQAD